MTTIESMQALLEERGLIVGARDKNRNTAFIGAFMVAEPLSDDHMPTECAGDAYCVVGDNLNELIVDAYYFFEG